MSNTTMPATINELVRERIQKDFVSLIPAENWTQLVDGVVKEFTVKKLRNRNSGNERSTSDLEELVREDLEARFKEIIKAEFNSGKYQTMWDGYNQQIAPLVVQEICEKYSGRIFNSMSSGVVAQVMSNMRNVPGY